MGPFPDEGWSRTAAQARRCPRPSGLDKTPPARDAGAARPAGLHRRNKREDQHDQDAGPRAVGQAPERRRALWPVEHPDLHRGTDRRCPHRAVDHPGRDEREPSHATAGSEPELQIKCSCSTRRRRRCSSGRTKVGDIVMQSAGGDVKRGGRRVYGAAMQAGRRR